MSFTASLFDIIEENHNGLLGAAPSWERVPLAEVASILNGFAFKSQHFNKEKGIPLIRIRDVLDGETETFYEGEFEPRYLIEAGDLLIGMDGDFNSALWTGRRALLNQRVCKIEPDERFYDRRFLSYVLPGYLDAINAHTSAITVKHLSSRTVAEIPLPLPPVAEQSRIISELEAQFSRLDAAVQALQRVQANLTRYRAAVLRAACEGNLVLTEAELAGQEGRDYEPADQLLERILEDRRARWEAEELAKCRAKGKGPRDGWKQKYKKPPRPYTSDLPALPEGWIWTSVQTVAETSSGGTPSRSQPSYFGGDIPWVKSGELNDGLVHDVEESITREGLDNSSAKVFPEGTLCIALYGATVGRLGLLQMDAATNQAVCGIHLPKGIEPWFLFYYLMSQREALISRGKGGAQSNISQGIVRETPVPLPPKDEQRRIVDEIERRFSVVDQITESVQRDLRRADRLRRSVLKRAFEGKVVPQDPSEEPASALLERIRASHEGGKSKKRSCKPAAETA